MFTRLLCVLCTAIFMITGILAQDTLKEQDVSKNPVKGYHIGIVQPLISIQKGEVTNLLDYDVYSVGFPIGISLATPGKAIIDMEVVPFVAAALELRENFEVHILYHPGILYPLGSGFTLGLRLAFESGKGQFGFTPLINKSFPINKHSKFFLEIVAPGRFGPNEKTPYTQIFGLHAGVAF
jgi:hypothetical protein